MKISLKNGKQLIISLVYLSKINTKNSYEHFFDFCKSLMISYDNATFLILGDFNLPGIQWRKSVMGFLNPYNYKGFLNEFFVDMINYCELYQFNPFINYKDNTLDLVLSNIGSNKIICVSLEESLVLKVDPAHPPIQVKLSLNIIKLQNKFNRNLINFHKLDYQKISNDLSIIDWEKEFKSHCTDDCLTILYDKIYATIDKHYKKRKLKSSKYPSWFSKKLISFIRLKAKFHKKFLNFKSEGYKKSYEFFRIQVKTELKRCHSKFISYTEDDLCNEPKKFWNFVKSQKLKSDYPLSMNYKNNYSEDPHIISNWFAEYFESVYSVDNDPDSDQKFLQNVKINNTNETVIEKLDVEFQIKNLDSSKGAGPDGLPSIFIKSLKYSFNSIDLYF